MFTRNLLTYTNTKDLHPGAGFQLNLDVSDYCYIEEVLP